MSYADSKPTEKKCPACETVKELKGGYYKAGAKAYQSLCKCCHNKSRKNFKKNKYQKKGTGFKRLPEELQNIIRKDVHDGIFCTNIYNRYKEEYPQLKYQTLLRWKKAGQILPPDNIDIDNDEDKKTENIENI